jgi:DNA-binding transcriptional regulator YiaG
MSPSHIVAVRKKTASAGRLWPVLTVTVSTITQWERSERHPQKPH